MSLSCYCVASCDIRACDLVQMACDLVWPPISLCRELPAKSAAEAKRHQKMHEQIVAAARKKGQQYQHKLPCPFLLQFWIVYCKQHIRQERANNYRRKPYMTYCTQVYAHFSQLLCAYMYSGTSVMWTPLKCPE